MVEHYKLPGSGDQGRTYFLKIPNIAKLRAKLKKKGVISLGGIVINHSIRTAGDEIDEAIVSFARREYNLLIGERMAEKVKIAAGSAYPLEEEIKVVLRGRDTMRGACIAALSFVSFGKPPVEHGPNPVVEPPLPHRSREKEYSMLKVGLMAG